MKNLKGFVAIFSIFFSTVFISLDLRAAQLCVYNNCGTSCANLTVTLTSASSTDGPSPTNPSPVTLATTGSSKTGGGYIEGVCTNVSPPKNGTAYYTYQASYGGTKIATFVWEVPSAEDGSGKIQCPFSPYNDGVSNAGPNTADSRIATFTTFEILKGAPSSCNGTAI